MSTSMSMILYGVLIAVMAVAGYFLGKTYTSVGPSMGAGIGIAAGALVSGVLWYLQPAASDDGLAAY